MLERQKVLFTHIEPFQAPKVQQASFYIILDMDKDSLPNLDFKSLPYKSNYVRHDRRGVL